MDDGGDPQMGADGGDGRRQQCKNLVAAARNRRDIGSVVPNSTKVIFKDHVLSCDVLQDDMILL
jgi:hypothetical protein